MTSTIIATNTITAGVAHTFAANGDQLTIIPGVTLGSTLGPVLGATGFNEISVTVLGTLISRSLMTFSGSSAFIQIAQGANFISHEANPGNAGIFLNNSGIINNSGTFLAEKTVGILSQGDSTVTNSGNLYAATPILIGLVGATGDVFINSGSVVAGAFGDATSDHRFNNGVLAEGGGTQVTNLAGGVIQAMSSAGAGVRFNDISGGSVVKNLGLIESMQDYGVNLGTTDAGQALIRVHNWGTISGGDGSYNGSVNADEVVNRGLFIGSVAMGDGADSFDNRTGRIEGDWNGGEGGDTYQGTQDTWVTGIISGGGGEDLLVGGLNLDRMQGDDGADRLYGREGADELHGGAGDDMIFGESGDDIIDGEAGVDHMRGGLGDDTYYVDRAGDIVVELVGEGTDTVNASSNHTLAANVENGVVNATGNRTLTGNGLNNVLTGNVGIDTLSGMAGNDELFGKDGNDVLNGGAGADLLTGGAGADRFVFSSAADTAWATYDTILDLQAADIIDLSGIDANSNVAGDQAFVKVSAFTNVAGQVRLLYSATSGDTYVVGDVNGDGVGDFRIRLVGNQSAWDNFVL